MWISGHFVFMEGSLKVGLVHFHLLSGAGGGFGALPRASAFTVHIIHYNIAVIGVLFLGASCGYLELIVALSCDQYRLIFFCKQVVKSTFFFLHVAHKICNVNTCSGSTHVDNVNIGYAAKHKALISHNMLDGLIPWFNICSFIVS